LSGQVHSVTSTQQDRTAPKALDNPVWTSITGAHADLAELAGRAGRYRVDVAPFAGLRDPADPAAWADLAGLTGPGGTVVMINGDEPPAGWRLDGGIPGVQMVAVDLRAEPDPAAVPLVPADVPEMLELIRRTEPGPFRDRTIDLGGYLGVRHEGRLIAMAGQRMRPAGWTEISAVCTDADFRGRGLASRLVRAVAVGIVARGETPFLHAAAANTGAIRLYESMGFALRRTVTFAQYRHVG
jgi:GNAT superfamily N-acetyltransferase